MNLLTVSTDLISIFLFTTLFLFFARKVAKKVGLVDKPNFRKRHQGLIPLVGGISVYAGICFTFGIVDYYIPHASLYLACAGVLVFIGALDDRFDISVKIRATIQAAVGIVMMVFGKLYLSSLGYIFGSWEMVLGPFGYFLTLFAVWAAINAFNMVDGIDGLLGGLSCVSFAAIGMILWFDGQTSLAIWCFAMIAAILPYIMLNLGKLLRIAAADIAGTLPVMKVSDHLTWLAEAMIDAVVQQAWVQMVARYGKPNHLNEREGRGFAASHRICCRPWKRTGAGCSLVMFRRVASIPAICSRQLIQSQRNVRASQT